MIFPAVQRHTKRTGVQQKLLNEDDLFDKLKGQHPELVNDSCSKVYNSSGNQRIGLINADSGLKFWFVYNRSKDLFLKYSPTLKERKSLYTACGKD